MLTLGPTVELVFIEILTVVRTLAKPTVVIVQPPQGLVLLTLAERYDQNFS